MRAEATIDRQQTTISDLNMRPMRNNIIVKKNQWTNVEKNSGWKNWEDYPEFFMDEMMRTPNVDNICINNSRRMAQENDSFNRMLIARLPCCKDQTTISDSALNLQGNNIRLQSNFHPR